MPALADLIMKLEGQEDLEVSIIRKTKIHKVLRGITKLNNIPRDSDFNFRQRALSLLEKWNANMAGEPETPGLLDDGKDEKAETGEAKQKPVNGVHKKSKDAIMDDEEMPTAASVLTSTQNASPNTSHPVKGEEEDA